MLINSEHCYSFKIPSPPFLLLFLGDGWSEFQGGNWSVCLLFPHWPLSVSCGMHRCMLASSDGHGPPGTSSLIPHSVLVDLPQKGSEISELLFLPPAEGCRILWAWPQVHLQSGNFLKCTGFLGFTLRSFCRTYPLQLIFFIIWFEKPQPLVGNGEPVSSTHVVLFSLLPFSLWAPPFVPRRVLISSLCPFASSSIAFPTLRFLI